MVHLFQIFTSNQKLHENYHTCAMLCVDSVCQNYNFHFIVQLCNWLSQLLKISVTIDAVYGCFSLVVCM